jgi:hypothetical protein
MGLSCFEAELAERRVRCTRLTFECQRAVKTVFPIDENIVRDSRPDDGGLIRANDSFNQVVIVPERISADSSIRIAVPTGDTSRKAKLGQHLYHNRC